MHKASCRYSLYNISIKGLYTNIQGWPTSTTSLEVSFFGVNGAVIRKIGDEAEPLRQESPLVQDGRRDGQTGELEDQYRAEQPSASENGKNDIISSDQMDQNLMTRAEKPSGNPIARWVKSKKKDCPKAAESVIDATIRTPIKKLRSSRSLQKMSSKVRESKPYKGAKKFSMCFKGRSNTHTGGGSVGGSPGGSPGGSSTRSPNKKFAGIHEWHSPGQERTSDDRHSPGQGRTIGDWSSQGRSSGGSFGGSRVEPAGGSSAGGTRKSFKDPLGGLSEEQKEKLAEIAKKKTVDSSELQQFTVKMDPKEKNSAFNEMDRQMGKQRSQSNG